MLELLKQNVCLEGGAGGGDNRESVCSFALLSSMSAKLGIILNPCWSADLTLRTSVPWPLSIPICCHSDIDF